MTDWIPETCTLPTAERPFRSAEFDALFRDDLETFSRVLPESLVLRFGSRPGLVDTLTDLTRRESSCCSFFRFRLDDGGGTVTLHVGVPTPRTDVLDGLERRAALLAQGQPR